MSPEADRSQTASEPNVPGRLDSRAPSPADSDGHSDWATTAKTEARQRKRREELTKKHGRQLSPTMEEQDEEDEQDFIDEALLASKQCVRNRPQTPGEDGDEDEPSGRHQDDEDDEDGPETADKQPEPIYKAGPIPEEAKEAAFALHQTYQQQMQELTNQYEKPVKHFYQLVGQDSVKSRRLNPWNAFQAWYGVHGEPHPEGGEYTVVLSAIRVVNNAFSHSFLSRLEEICGREIQPVYQPGHRLGR